MQKFDWTLIQSFLAVAEAGSYSGAARMTRHSQPTIGRHVQQLQEQLGTVLFQRAAKGYALTETGMALMKHANDMQMAAAQISMVAEGGAEEIAGTVRITASEIVATYMLPEILAALMRDQPELQIELVATNSTENLSLREADIAVRMVRPQQPELISRKLGEIPVGLFAAQSYLDHAGELMRVEDFLDHTVIGYDQSPIMLQAMKDLGIPASREDFKFRIDDQVAYFEAMVAGVGIGAMQSFLARDRGLVPVLPDILIPPLPVWLTAHQELRTSARVRCVFDFLAERLAASLKSQL